MKKLKVNTINHSYPIVINPHLFKTKYLAKFCQEITNRIVIIADHHVAKLYGKAMCRNLSCQNIKTNLLTFPAGEKYKNRKTKENLENKLFELGCGRDTGLIALGGGVTTDLVGFIASTYCRGIPVIHIPTTLLAMVDACIGGKTGVDTSFGKNLIGTFYQPTAIFIDPDFLKTLPIREFNNGLVEMIKHGFVIDKEYLDWLQRYHDEILSLKNKIVEYAIGRSCEIKIRIVEQDVQDRGIRQILNFGHTISHALEQLSYYQLNHGEAVALGIVAESYLSCRLGFLSQSQLDEAMNILKKFEVLVPLKRPLIWKTFKSLLRLDKKNRNQQTHVILLDQIGTVHRQIKNYTMPVQETLIKESIEFLYSEVNKHADIIYRNRKL